jgi:murein DD-endopeptidase MepM/ murein hydrolase activator NlpD
MGSRFGRRWMFMLLLAVPMGWMALPVLKAGPRALSLCLEKSPVRLPMPVSGVRPVQVADTFGAPRSGGRRHEGIDIFAPRHTPIHSTTEGLVVSFGENRLGGRSVRVLGPGAQWHYYAHLETYGVLRVGQRVPAGYVLGTVGDSGNARGTPTHLHYGTYRFFGQAINPWPRLQVG